MEAIRRDTFVSLDAKERVLGVEKEGEDHPLLLPGGSGQGIEGGGHAVRLVTISVLI